MERQEVERHSSQCETMKQQTREHEANTVMTAMKRVVVELVNEH